jgi:hypothetical protein
MAEMPNLFPLPCIVNENESRRIALGAAVFAGGHVQPLLEGGGINRTPHGRKDFVHVDNGNWLAKMETLYLIATRRGCGS